MRPIRPEGTECRAWADAWHRHRSRSALEANLDRGGFTEEAFWSHYSTWVSSMRGDYPGALLDRVRTLVTPESTVLDVGAGAGAFAIPLAAVSRRVTAVEPSPAQAAQLSEALERAQVRNVDVLRNRWEDVDVMALGSHELVLAVHSFQMADIAEALRKMCAAAARHVALIHTAGHSLSTLSRELFDIEPGPDYTYLHHMLVGLGYEPRVEFVDYCYQIPLDIQLDILRYNPGLSSTECSVLREYVVRHGMTSCMDGTLWLRRAYRDALITVTDAASDEKESTR